MVHPAADAKKNDGHIQTTRWSHKGHGPTVENATAQVRRARQDGAYDDWGLAGRAGKRDLLPPRTQLAAAGGRGPGFRSTHI